MRIKDLRTTLCEPVVCPDFCPNDESATSEWAHDRPQLRTEPEANRGPRNRCQIPHGTAGNRQWGKTTTTAIKALHLAIAKPDQTIVILSRTKHQAAILMNKAGIFTLRMNIRIRRVMGFAFSLQLPNGSNIIAVAHSGDTSVGNTAHVLIVDEAALVQDSVYWSVSASVSRTHGKIWIMSTPRRQAGSFYNFWHSKTTKCHRIFSNVPTTFFCPRNSESLTGLPAVDGSVKSRARSPALRGVLGGGA